MANQHPALTLALGAGSGLALWFLLRDDPRKPRPTPAAPAGATSRATAPSAKAAPVVAAPCQLRLTAAGLTADGRSMDIPSAVARCKATGRAEVSIAGDAPGSVYAQLATVLAEVGVIVTPHRNGRSIPQPARRHRQAARVDLSDFAATVAELAHEIDADPTPEGLARGRFGDRKVFIAAIRRGLRGTRYGRLPRETLDELLIESMRQRLLQLARADLVAAMDPAEVRDSEIRYLNASFHFVIAEPSGAGNDRHPEVLP